MTPETHWQNSLLALGLGLLAAVIFVVIARRAFKAAPTDALSVDDLQARYGSLIAQLKEHAEGKHLMPPEQWESEQQRLSAEAASLLRQRAEATHTADKARARAEKKAQADSAAGPYSGALKVGGWVMMAVLFFSAVGIVLSKEATPRQDEPNQGSMAPRVSPQQSAQLQALIEAAQRNPDDVDAIAQLSWALMKGQRFEDASAFVARGTVLDPYHVPTRIQRAVLDAVEGRDTEALLQLEHLANTYPDTGEAHYYAGTLAMGLNDPQRALKHFDQYLKEVPVSEQPPMLRDGVERLRAQLNAQAQ